MRKLLLDLACRSAMLRIARRAGVRLGTSPEAEEGAREQSWFAFSDLLRDDMAQLGRKLNGTGRDARVSPFWILLEHQWAYERTFAPVDHTELKELAPDAIYRGLSNGSTMHWEEWEISPISPHERENAEARTIMGSPIWVRNPGGARRCFNGVTLATATDIYLYIAISRPRRLIVPAPGAATVRADTTYKPAANSSGVKRAATGT